MQHWKMTLSYDGTGFHGWQVQPGLSTVQGTVAAAIRTITREVVLPQGSGRTDRGVHAHGQVASFSLACRIPAANLQRALNRTLPASIRVLKVEAVSSEFHARHSAIRKTYEYRLFPGATAKGHSAATCSPMLAPYVWDCPLQLDLELMERAARAVMGTHDFTSFASSDPDRSSRDAEPDIPAHATNVRTLDRSSRDAEPDIPAHATNVRTLDRSSWQGGDGLYVYRVSGSGFLHHMVRNLVGTFAEVGRGRFPPDAIPEILAARSRAAAGPTAPARGLSLIEVEY